MTRDFTGRTAPYGTTAMMEEAIVDHSLWVFVAYIPYSAYEVGVETVTRQQYLGSGQGFGERTDTIPVYGHCNWEDFEIKLANNEQPSYT